MSNLRTKTSDVRGITLIELLISLAIVVLVTAATARAYSLAITYDRSLRENRAAALDRQNFEDKITNLLHHAWLSASTTDPNSYFIAGAPSATATASNLPGGLRSTLQTSAAPGGAASGSSSSGASQGSGTGAYGTPNELVFTAAGFAAQSAYLASNDDFETLNTNFSAQGGIREVQISQDPAGAQGQGKTGLFLRTQTPADNDPTQGGSELLVTPSLTQLGFELFDGNNWQTSWDTRSQTPQPGNLPPAIRVTYRFKGDDYDHVFVVRLPASTVNYNNPVTVTG